MRFQYCPHCGKKAELKEIGEELGLHVKSVEYVKSYPYEKKEMLMLGFKAVAEKKDFSLSGEVDDAQWVKLEDAPGLLREGSIAWQLVKIVAGDSERFKGGKHNIWKL